MSEEDLYDHWVLSEIAHLFYYLVGRGLACALALQTRERIKMKCPARKSTTPAQFEWYFFQGREYCIDAR